MDNPEFLEVWLEQIVPYTAGAIEKGMKQYFKEEAYFPVPGTLIPHIKDQINCMEPKQ